MRQKILFLNLLSIVFCIFSKSSYAISTISIEELLKEDQFIMNYEYNESDQEVIVTLGFTDPELPLNRKKILIEAGLGYLFPVGLSFETKAILIDQIDDTQLLIAKLQMTSNLRYSSDLTQSIAFATHYPITNNFSLGPVTKLWIQKSMLTSGLGLDADFSFKPLKKSLLNISLQGQITYNNSSSSEFFAIHSGIILRIPLNRLQKK